MQQTHKAKVELVGDRSFTITREFAGPRERVWQAWTTPELVARWWAGQRGTVDSIEIDLRVGGRWRYVMTAHGGHEVAFNGEYLELEPEHRMVSTEVFEPFPDAPSTNTLTLTEIAGGTLLTVLVEHLEPAHRDMHLESGMETGMNEGMDILEGLVREG